MPNGKNPTSFLDSWYQPDRTGRGGTPTTEQEKAFILDFMGKTGRAPTESEVGQGFSRTFDARESVWTPESTMGRMGFKTWDEYSRAQREEEPYGPHGGSLVPEGGVVLTDMSGKPILRTYNPEKRIPRSRYVVPPGMERYGTQWNEFFGRPGGFEGDTSVYPQYDRGEFVNPTMEEALGRYAPEQVYEARLYDYLTNKVQEDAPEIQRLTEDYNGRARSLNDRLSLGKLSEEEYNKAVIVLRNTYETQVGQLMSENKAAKLQEEALNLLKQGTPAAELPMFGDIQGVTGATVQEIYDRMLESSKQEYERQQSQIPEFKGYPGRESVAPTGQEQREYLTYIERLGVAPEYKNYLSNLYWDIYDQWRRSGMFDTFLMFAKEYFKNGGL